MTGHDMVLTASVMTGMTMLDTTNVSISVNIGYYTDRLSFPLPLLAVTLLLAVMLVLLARQGKKKDDRGVGGAVVTTAVPVLFLAVLLLPAMFFTLFANWFWPNTTTESDRFVDRALSVALLLEEEAELADLGSLVPFVLLLFLLVLLVLSM